MDEPEKDPLLDKFKTHINIDEGMDESMLVFYLSAARHYVGNVLAKPPEYLILMAAAMFYDFRVPEKDMAAAVDSMTPFFVQEVMTEDDEADEQTQVDSDSPEE